MTISNEKLLLEEGSSDTSDVSVWERLRNFSNYMHLNWWKDYVHEGSKQISNSFFTIIFRQSETKNFGM